MKSKLGLEGQFNVEHIRDGKVINAFEIPNAAVNEGLDKLLDVMFHAVTAIGTWYLGLVDNASWTAFAAADTMASHAGWIESVAYDEATRNEWTEGAAASQSITNAAAVTFTMSATAAIKGIFVCSDNTKSGTSGTLWATGAFAAVQNVVDNDELKVTYTVNASAV